MNVNHDNKEWRVKIEVWMFIAYVVSVIFVLRGKRANELANVVST
jgi:hypothetical protein